MTFAVNKIEFRESRDWYRARGRPSGKEGLEQMLGWEAGSGTEAT